MPMATIGARSHWAESAGESWKTKVVSASARPDTTIKMTTRRTTCWASGREGPVGPGGGSSVIFGRYSPRHGRVESHEQGSETPLLQRRELSK